MKQVVEKNDQIKIHLGSGNGELTAPKGVTKEQVKQIVEKDFPIGTQNRKQKILDALANAVQN